MGRTPTIHVAEVVVAKLAAHFASAVPGVNELRAGLTGTVASFAGRVARRDGDAATDLPTDGVRVTVDEDAGTATVTIDAVLQLGAPFLEVARQIQQQVAGNIEHATGLAAIVTVNIVDVSDQGQPSA